MVIVFFLEASLATIYCFKSGSIFKSWPKVRVCLFSNSFWVISSKFDFLGYFGIFSKSNNIDISDRASKTGRSNRIGKSNRYRFD